MNNDPRIPIILNRRQRQRAKQGKGQTFIRAAAIGLISIVVAIGLFFSLTVGGAVAAYLSLTANLPDPAQIEALKTAGLRDQVKVIIGGAPVTEAYARDIGADGFAPDASRAVTLTKSLVG